MGHVSTRRTYVVGLAATALGASVGGCLGQSSTPTLHVGIVPDVDPDTAIEQNTPLANYLEERLDVEIELDTAADYAGMVRAMSAEQVDLAYYGGVSYVLAHHRAGARPLVVGSKDGSTLWNSVFVAHESVDIDGMEELTANAGAYDLVFGDPISTSGTVMPSYYLATEYDVDSETDFRKRSHVGAHDATAKTVESGSGDVGALNARIYDHLLEAGTVGDASRELWRTPGFPDYPWAVAPSVGEERFAALTEAFTSLDDAGATHVLERQNVDEYVPVGHDDFAALDSAVEMAGLLENGDQR